MATAEKIYLGIDGERVELTGADLTAFKAQRTKDAAEAKARQDEIEAASEEGKCLAEDGKTTTETESINSAKGATGSIDKEQGTNEDFTYQNIFTNSPPTKFKKVNSSSSRRRQC